MMDQLFGLLSVVGLLLICLVPLFGVWGVCFQRRV